MGGLSVRAGWLAVLLVTGLLAAACGGGPETPVAETPVAGETEPPDEETGVVLDLDGMTAEEVVVASARVLSVRVCDRADNPACIACDDSTKKGLILDRTTRVKCGDEVFGNTCKNGGSQVRWDFDGLAKGEEFRGSIRYVDDPMKPASGPAYPDAYCYKNGGKCQREGKGKGLDKTAFAILSLLARLKGTSSSPEVTYWPYRVDLEQKTGDAWTLIACADPEIIVDPPGNIGGVLDPVPAGEEPEPAGDP